MTAPPAPLENRLAQLEADNRSLRRQCRWTQLLLAGAAALLVGFSCAGTGGVLNVQTLNIRDDAGRIRLAIGYQDTSEWITQRFFDDAGTERIRLAIASNGTARQRLFDQQGLLRVSSSTYRENHPKAPGVAGSVYYDKNEKKRIRLATDAKGKAVQQFKDGQGENRLETAVDTTGRIELLQK